VAGVAGGTNDLTITGNLDLDGAATGLGFLSVSGTSNLGANVTTATTQTYTGAVTLSGGNRTLAGTTINFGSTLDGGAAALTVTGNLDLNGAATNLTTLSVSGTSNLGGNVTSTGTQTYSGATTLSGGARTLTASTVNFGSTLDGGNDALTITGNLDLDGAATNLTTLSVSGTSDIGGNVTTTGTQSYGNVVLTANATFTTTDSAVTFGGTVDSDGTPRAFSVVAGTGQIDIVGNIGGISPMASIYLGTTGDAILGGSATTGSFQTNAGGTTYLGGDITATGFIQFSDAVVLTADVTLATSGTAGLYVMSTIDSDGTPRNLVLSITGVTGELALTSNIGATSALASLTASAIDMLTIGGNVTTTGAQSYSAADIRLNNAGTRVLTGTSASFTGPLRSLSGGVSALNVTGDAAFSSTVGVGGSLNTLTVGGTTSLGGNVTTTGAQSYTGLVTITAPVTLTGTLVTLTGGLTGTDDLTVAAAAVLGGDVNTGTGLQTYNGAVTLAGAAGTRTLTGGTVTFQSTVNALVAGDQGLAVDGAAVFNGIVGGTAALASLSVSGTSAIGANVTTTGNQIYTGAATLSGGDRTLAGSTIQFGDTLAGGTNGLTITGNLDLDGEATGLTTLSVSGTSDIAANVTSSGNQSYGGVVTLSANAAFTSTTGNIDFDAAIAGAGFTLDIDAQGATGTVDFGGDVVADVLTVSADQLNLAAGVDLDTSGANGNISLFVDGLALAGTNTINAGTGTFQITPRTTTHTVEFGSTDTGLATDVYYDSDFTGITAGQFIVGDAAHSGRIYVGEANVASALTVRTTGGVTLFGNLTTAGTTIIDANLAVDGATRTVNTTDGDFTVTGTTDGANVGGNDRLAVQTGTGTATFTGVIGGTTDLERLNVVGAVAFLPNLTVGEFSRGPGGAITTTLTGDTYASTVNGFQLLGIVTLTANTSITSAGSIHFDVMNGAAFDLSANAATTVSILGAMMVANLDVTAGTRIYIQGDVTTAGGVQDYDGLADILGSRTLEAATVIFRGAIDANDAFSSLAIVGDAQFLGAVGAPDPLASLSVSGATTIGADVTTSGAQRHPDLHRRGDAVGWRADFGRHDGQLRLDARRRQRCADHHRQPRPRRCRDEPDHAVGVGHLEPRRECDELEQPGLFGCCHAFGR
ncbi:MAG: hypothetical protein LC632_05290, partial [Xanthomonadaceae bacterium]|nr:hypothetical protein [Xanthomonadaceae bacterium]